MESPRSTSWSRPLACLSSWSASLSLSSWSSFLSRSSLPSSYSISPKIIPSKFLTSDGTMLVLFICLNVFILSVAGAAAVDSSRSSDSSSSSRLLILSSGDRHQFKKQQSNDDVPEPIKERHKDYYRTSGSGRTVNGNYGQQPESMVKKWPYYYYYYYHYPDDHNRQHDEHDSNSRKDLGGGARDKRHHPASFTKYDLQFDQEYRRAPIATANKYSSDLDADDTVFEENPQMLQNVINYPFRGKRPFEVSQIAGKKC